MAPILSQRFVRQIAFVEPARTVSDSSLCSKPTRDDTLDSDQFTLNKVLKLTIDIKFCPDGLGFQFKGISELVECVDFTRECDPKWPQRQLGNGVDAVVSTGAVRVRG